MPTVVGVRLREAGKLYHFDPNGLGLRRLDPVVVETQGGMELGRCVTECLEKSEGEIVPPLRRVVRKATPQDLERQRQNRERAREVLEYCRRRVGELGLAIRVVDAELAFDGSRLTVHFTAEERVDFRALVRELGARYHVRVDMRQVGARDEAKLLDGVGPCGQRLCCARWLSEFRPVSIRMAKLQNLALNPGKLAGNCGRLKCCLRFELEAYEEGQKQLPPVGTRVATREGEGRVIATNPLQPAVQVLFDDGPRWLPAYEVFRSNGCEGGPEGGCACGGR
jgi:cell fate regulator YaaT (PSP1 superfamily)